MIKHLAKLWFLIAVLFFSGGAISQTTWNIVPGWNLLGNSSAAPIDTAGTFGNAAKITSVWKWSKTASKWAFYSPSMSSTELSAYAQNKNYDVLTSIASKEGFWVNASSATSLTGPTANGLTLAESDLQVGWNLVSSADNKAPSQLSQVLSSSLNAAGKTIRSAWSWDSTKYEWKFYAPLLDVQGGTVLTDYISSKGYQSFSNTLSASDGYWLNVEAVTPSEKLSITNAFDNARTGNSIQDVMGISKKPDSYSSTRLILGVSAATGDTINALSIIQKVASSVDPNRIYSFALQANISRIWNYLDGTSTLRAAINLDGVPITKASPSPGTTYTSINNASPITVYDAQWFTGRPDYSMWNGDSGPYTVTLPGSELNRLSFLVGNELSSQVYIHAPPDGNFSLIFNRNYYSDATPNVGTPTEYLSALDAFGTRFSGTAAPQGCTLITQYVSTAVGAPLASDIWRSAPKDNPTRAGHWTAVYKGDSGQVPSWSALLMPGDVVNLVLRGGAQHTFSVISVNGMNVETIDNVRGTIGRGTYNYEGMSNPASVTIYRLDATYATTSDRIFNWFEGVYPDFLPGQTATQEANGYLVRQYSTGWAMGTKGNHLYVRPANSTGAYDMGSYDDYLSIANLNGY